MFMKLAHLQVAVDEAVNQSLGAAVERDKLSLAVPAPLHPALLLLPGQEFLRHGGED